MHAGMFPMAQRPCFLPSRPLTNLSPHLSPDCSSTNSSKVAAKHISVEATDVAAASASPSGTSGGSASSSSTSGGTSSGGSGSNTAAMIGEHWRANLGLVWPACKSIVNQSQSAGLLWSVSVLLCTPHLPPRSWSSHRRWGGAGGCGGDVGSCAAAAACCAREQRSHSVLCPPAAHPHTWVAQRWGGCAWILCP